VFEMVGVSVTVGEGVFGWVGVTERVFVDVYDGLNDGVLVIGGVTEDANNCSDMQPERIRLIAIIKGNQAPFDFMLLVQFFINHETLLVFSILNNPCFDNRYCFKNPDS
jgi:hypothetical protein